jgi:hypothetical protein
MNRKTYLIIVVLVVVVVLLSIILYTMLANHRPVITSLEAEPEKVTPSGSCQIICTASDHDGDELSYAWSASGGGITGEGTTVSWTAPDSAGSYIVTATVNDGRGGVVTKQTIITVRANKPPTINSVTPNTDWTNPSGSVQVTCTASDPDGDELSYEWTATGGYISGTGVVVEWTAPEASGEYVVTVVVTDDYGGSAISGVDIDVSSTESAANLEAESVKTDSLCYFGEYGYWPDTSDDLTLTYVSGPLKAIYYFDTEWGWIVDATPTVGGWNGVEFVGGVPGPTGQHGRWVKS